MLEDRPIGPDAVYTMFHLDGKSVAALYQQEPSRGALPPHWLSYISVDAAPTIARRAAELGGSVLMDAFDVLDVGRMAVIQDPGGAVVALWEPKRHIGAGVVGEPNTLCWNELVPPPIGRRPGGSSQSCSAGAATTQRLGDIAYTMFMRGGTAAVGGMMQIGPDGGRCRPIGSSISR